MAVKKTIELEAKVDKAQKDLDGVAQSVQRIDNNLEEVKETSGGVAKGVKGIGNALKAAGVGITLTSAEAVIMNDLSFVPSDHSQAEDRAYRYGQKFSVSVYYPIFENTIEGIIYNILTKKKNIFETVMGDNEGKGDVMEEILNMISQKS